MGPQTDLPPHRIAGESPNRALPEHAMTLDDLVLDDSLPKVQVRILLEIEDHHPTPPTLLTELQCEV